MTHPIKFLNAAEVEAFAAIDWYEERETGLGTAFRESVEAAIEAISSNPRAYQIVFGTTVRRAMTDRFPYSIIYSIEADTVLIVSIFHNSRNPTVWRGRVS